MFGIRIKLTNEAFLSVDNWRKILKTVVLVSVAKSTIFTSGARAREVNRDEQFIEKHV